MWVKINKHILTAVVSVILFSSITYKEELHFNNITGLFTIKIHESCRTPLFLHIGNSKVGCKCLFFWGFSYSCDLLKKLHRCYKNSVLYCPWSKFTALQEDFVKGPCSLQTEQTPGDQLVAVTKKSERDYKTFLKKIWNLIPFFIMFSTFTWSLLFFPVHFFRYFFYASSTVE